MRKNNVNSCIRNKSAEKSPSADTLVANNQTDAGSADNNTQFRNDFINAMQNNFKVEYCRLPEAVKDNIQLFVSFATDNDLSNTELLDCLQYMPTKLAKQVLSQLPKNLADDLYKQLTKIYTDEFIYKCEKSKTGKPKIKNIASYKQAYTKNNNIRFFSYDETFEIANHLNFPLDKLLFGKIEDCKDKYQKALKEIHAEMFSSDYRSDEHKFFKKWNERFILDAIDRQKEMLNKRIKL